MNKYWIEAIKIDNFIYSTQIQSVTLYILRTIDCIIMIFGTQV